jgi:hypothetical protein
VLLAGHVGQIITSMVWVPIDAIMGIHEKEKFFRKLMLLLEKWIILLIIQTERGGSWMSLKKITCLPRFFIIIFDPTISFIRSFFDIFFFLTVKKQYTKNILYTSNQK